ncbi:MAG: hypothetical protein MUF42_12125 [Cytophagaceae bacterium]|jgi:hypothetical protein|nr:hypothetical protein [Cytophagaceae bacterium]
MIHQSTHLDTFSAFLLGALFNVFASLDMTSIADYTVKALIGGIIWAILKVASDYMVEWLKKDTTSPVVKSDDTVASALPLKIQANNANEFPSLVPAGGLENEVMEIFNNNKTKSKKTNQGDNAIKKVKAKRSTSLPSRFKGKSSESL